MKKPFTDSSSRQLLVCTTVAAEHHSGSALLIKYVGAKLMIEDALPQQSTETTYV